MCHERFRRLIVGAAFALSLAAWPFLPGSVPASWGLPPAAGAWVSRTMAAFLLPLVAAAVSAILGRLLAADARASARASSRATCELATDAGIVLILGTHATLVTTLLAGPRPWLAYALPLLVGLVALVVGNALPRIRPNAAFGIRTPWTVGDVRVWATAHRAGGYIMVAYGLVILGATFAATRWIGWLVGPGAFALVALLVFVSYVARRAERAGGAAAGRQ